MHQITAKADSLEALTITHRKEKQNLDDEIDIEREVDEYEFRKKVKPRN